MEEGPGTNPSRTDPPKPGKPPEPNLWAMTGKGMELAVVVGVFAFIGWQIDKWLDSEPWFCLVLAGLGLAGGMYNLWKGVKRYL